MAKRFIDTDVFKKQFVRGLQGAYKLLWIYVTTDCNHAGIWEVDFDVAQIRIGSKINKITALKVFKDKIVEIDGGSKWFIPSFIEFQYGQLSEKNRAHINVISLLSKYGLIDENFDIKPLSEDSRPLVRSFEGPMDMEQEKEKGKEQVKEELENPFSTSFLKTWKGWIEYKKVEHNDRFKSVKTEQQGLNNLFELSEGDEALATKIIQQSIGNKWKGLFKISTDGTNRKTSTESNGKLGTSEARIAGVKTWGLGGS